jgi:hypothetical protein
MSASCSDPRERLASIVHEAEVHVNRAEAGVALVEARLRLLDATFAEARELAREANIPLSGSTVDVPKSSALPPHMAEGEFARFMRVSPRTMAYRRKHMTEGVHFHLHGRRVIYHVAEAADFIRRGGGRPLPTEDLEQLAIDEVTRRRARIALRRAGGPK